MEVEDSMWKSWHELSLYLPTYTHLFKQSDVEEIPILEGFFNVWDVQRLQT